MIKRSGLLAAAIVCTLAASGGFAIAGDKPVAGGSLTGWQTVKPTELKTLKGGTETDGKKIIDSFDTTQTNEAHLAGANVGNSINNGGVFSTGGATATVTGNRGVTSVTQVTGAMNNVANNVMYNIYLK